MNNLLIIILIALIALGGIGLVIGVLIIIFRGNDVGERINQYIDQTSTASSTSSGRQYTQISRFRYQLNLALSMFNSEEFQMKLTSANWQITVTEYHLLRISISIILLLLGYWISGSLIVALAIAIIAFMIPGFLLFQSVQRRQRKFHDQMIDSLTLIQGAVRSGASFLQSLDVVIDEMAEPTSEEFRRVRKEVELGLPLSQALTNLANRMENDDLYLVVSAITINMQIGGNLTIILESVTETIRNRVYLFGEIRSLTSYARYTSYLLSILPFITALVLVILSPTYFEQLMAPGLTRYILIYAAISLLLGNIVLRQVSKIDV